MQDYHYALIAAIVVILLIVIHRVADLIRKEQRERIRLINERLDGFYRAWDREREGLQKAILTTGKDVEELRYAVDSQSLPTLRQQVFALAERDGLLWYNPSARWGTPAEAVAMQRPREGGGISGGAAMGMSQGAKDPTPKRAR